MSDAMREAFERSNIVPDDAEYNERIDCYRYETHPGVSHPFNEVYDSFQDGWQAALEHAGQQWLEMTKAARHIQKQHLDNHQGDVYHAMQYLCAKHGHRPTDQKWVEELEQQRADLEARGFEPPYSENLDEIGRDMAADEAMRQVEKHAGPGGQKPVMLYRNSPTGMHVDWETLPYGSHYLYDQPPAPAVPEGWKLVPVEPVAEMQTAGAQAVRFETTTINKMWTANAAYRAMLNAAPEAPDQ